MSGISDGRRYSLRIAAGVMLVVALVAMSGCSSLTRWYFHPQTLWLQTPDRFGVAYEDIWLTSADGTQLHAWHLIPASLAEPNLGEQSTPAPMILYLHGNAENVSTHSRSIYWLVEAGYRVLALDYRGFGASQGVAELPGVLDDVEAGAAWLREQWPSAELTVLGQSIGSALAVNFVADKAGQYQVERLVLDAPFTGFRSVARDVLMQAPIGFLLWPFVGLVPSDWDPEDKAPEINIPVLVMHSQQDEIIPIEQGRALFAALPSEQRCWMNSIGRHIASFGYDRIRAQTLVFLQTSRCPSDPSDED